MLRYHLRQNAGEVEYLGVQVGQVGHDEDEQRLDDPHAAGEPVGRGGQGQFSCRNGLIAAYSSLTNTYCPNNFTNTILLFIFYSYYLFYH